MIYNAPDLSGLESALLAAWERERKHYVSLDELRQQLGRDARGVVVGLVQKGLLERIAPGRYLVHPFRSLSRPRVVSAPVVAAALLADETYYLGGWWAFTLHRLTQQVYGSLLDAYVTHERRSRRLRSVRLVFHVLPSTAFEYGIETVRIEETNVRASDAERTVLDALDYPKTFGGVRTVLKLVAPAIERVDRRQLVSYAARGSHPSTCQRLAVLLERGGAAPRLLAPLGRRVRETTSLLSMLPDAPRSGKVNSKWRVVENDQGAYNQSDEDRGFAGSS